MLLIVSGAFGLFRRSLVVELGGHYVASLGLTLAAVKTDQPMVSVETAKAIVDIPAPYDGKVVKTFGAMASRGLMSFPRPGATLAIDFPNRGPRTLALLGTLDALTEILMASKPTSSKYAISRCADSTTSSWPPASFRACRTCPASTTRTSRATSTS